MNRYASHARRGTGPAVALVAAGLVLAGCGTSSSSPAGTGKPAAAAAKSPAASSAGTSGSGSETSSSSAFPIGVGNTWVYSNSLGGTVTNKMTAVTPVSGGQQVTMANTISMSSSTTNQTYVFHSDGSITYPSSELGSDVTIVSGGLTWPATSVIAAGTPTRSTLEIALTSSGQHLSEKAHITVRGDGTASVTVPAGTYNATIVIMTMKWAFEGYAFTSQVKTWVVNGTGPVQDEVITTEAGTPHVMDVQKLESFTKG